MQDRRCRYALASRIDMVNRREAGQSLRAIAAALACSPTTVKTICDRWNAADEASRSDFTCLLPRAPIPRSCPHALSPEQEQKILDARARTGWGPMRLTELTGRHRSTIWKVLHRHGQSRIAREPRPQFKRYEWSQPGALLHIDALKLPRFDRPGHFATGQRGEEHKSGAGELVVVGVIDDHTRLAYCELHPAENAQAVSVTLKRAAAWMLEQGCGPVEAVMSDNAKCYSVSHLFRDTLTEIGAKQILIPPYTPRWNGKIERFFGTAKREWSHGRTWPTSAERDRALSSWMRYYNRKRPHSAAGGQAPITRVQQDREHDT